MARLTEQEQQEVIRFIEAGVPLPDKYRFLLFDDKREVELVWNGKTNEVTNVVLPFQTIEQVDEPRAEKPEDTEAQQDLFAMDSRGRQLRGWTNKLIWGDNKLILSSLKNGPLREEIERHGGIKLIYIDPPFDVGADFSMEIPIGNDKPRKRCPKLKKQPNILEEIAYRDTWGKGADSFISMMFERLQLLQGLMAEDASIYVHCDRRVNSYLRLVMDEIFGRSSFVNEIIWHYKTFQGQTHAYFAKKHDTLLLYRKGSSHIYNEIFEPNVKDTIDFKRWNAYLDDRFCIHGDNMPTQDSRFIRYLDKWVAEHGRQPGKNDIVFEVRGQPVDSVWEIKGLDPKSSEKEDYPTQKPEALLDRIVRASSRKGDLVMDVFSGSGTTAVISEKLGRKWIVSDLGKFAIHTTRKRMIGIQRELKTSGKDYRAFEILNLGKYERQHYVGVNPSLREEQRQQQLEARERAFLDLILAAYRAEKINGFASFHGKKAGRLVAIGPVNMPVSRRFIEEIILECYKNRITKVDILGFEFEMGLFPNILDDACKKGIKIAPKYIPRDVFDKRAVERNQVVFHDVAFIDVHPHFKDNTVAVELMDFSVFYSQDSIAHVEATLNNNTSKVVVENGAIIKVSKGKDGILTREQLTKTWKDWIDYWSVDFNFESKREIVRVQNPDTGNWEEQWTGDYIFENEWQSFRTRKDRSLELMSVYHECAPGWRKIAVKVVDIFGNDTMTIVNVNVGGKN